MHRLHLLALAAAALVAIGPSVPATATGPMPATGPTPATRPTPGTGTTTNAVRETSFTWHSTPDDPVAHGTSGRWTEADATFDVGLGNDGVLAYLTPPAWDAQPWRIWLTPGTSAGLGLGEWRQVHGYRGPDPHPEIDISFGEYPSCATSATGQFQIDEWEKDGNAVVAAEITFTQHCGGRGTLTGTLRYRVLPLSLAVRSFGDDPIGVGVRDVYKSSGAVFDGGNEMDGVTVFASTDEGSWILTFVPPDGVMTTGRWTGARKTTGNAQPYPQLNVVHNNRECESLTGWFKITGLTLSDGWYVEGIGVTFEVRCAGHTGSLKGTLHFHA